MYGNVGLDPRILIVDNQREGGGVVARFTSQPLYIPVRTE